MRRLECHSSSRMSGFAAICAERKRPVHAGPPRVQGEALQRVVNSTTPFPRALHASSDAPNGRRTAFGDLRLAHERTRNPDARRLPVPRRSPLPGQFRAKGPAVGPVAGSQRRIEAPSLSRDRPASARLLLSALPARRYPAMRIAYFTSQYPATSHTFIRREVAAVRQHGLDVLTYSVRQPGSHERQTPQERAEFEATWYILPPRLDLVRAHFKALLTRPHRYIRALRDALGHRVPGLKALVYAFLYFGEAIYLAERLRADRVGHLHNHFANPAGIVGFLASRYLGITWSITLHGISEFDYPAGQLLGAKLEQAKFVACVAHFTRAQAMRTIGPEHWSKLFINRCGVPVQDVQRAERQREETARLRIVCVARLSPEKGLVGLVDAFARLVERGIDAELRILGDGPSRDTIVEAIASHGVDDRCELPGRIPEEAVARELADADIFAMTSFMEGLPVVIMEALALALPVVAPCVAGIPDLVEHEQTGLLFSPSNWDALTECLERLARDPALRRRLGRAGRSRVENEFDAPVAAQPIAAKFRELASRA
ncbi:MAG: glycosyltransferase family 4 protein [Myxococcales bacterium FL481]|nr:MAG: glycosyltransferase family 4 protein [Myxococcales bacterium FL481]